MPFPLVTKDIWSGDAALMFIVDEYRYFSVEVAGKYDCRLQAVSYLEKCPRRTIDMSLRSSIYMREVEKCNGWDLFAPRL